MSGLVFQGCSGCTFLYVKSFIDLQNKGKNFMLKENIKQVRKSRK